jgi:hypothetical protein
VGSCGRIGSGKLTTLRAGEQEAFTLGWNTKAVASDRFWFGRSSLPEQVLRREHSLLLEVGHGVGDRREDLGGGLGDEGAGVLLGLPDDVDLLGVLPGVLEFALDAEESRG